jgi:hypothetical protein
MMSNYCFTEQSLFNLKLIKKLSAIITQEMSNLALFYITCKLYGDFYCNSVTSDVTEIKIRNRISGIST